MKIFDSSAVNSALGDSASYLGTGGFGETWRVGSEAVKIIHRESADRVQREIESLTRVDHPNVVRLLSIDSVKIDGADYQAIRFAYIPGGDVGNSLRNGNFLPIPMVRPFLTGLLRGVQALHQAGILHRDLKPGNVALRDGHWSHPVILDLGLARVIDQTSITAYPALIGTLPYMAPEQILGRRVRKAADIFALGVLTRQSITGEHPFGLDAAPQDPEQVLRSIEKGPIPLPSAVPADTKSLLDRMVSAQEHRRGSVSACLRDAEGLN